MSDKGRELQERKDAILRAMLAAGRARRRRRLGARVATVAVAATVCTFTAYLLLSRPASPVQPPQMAAVPGTIKRPIAGIEPPKGPLPPAQAERRITAEYISPAPGISARRAVQPVERAVAVTELSDVELAGVLAEDTAFGLVRIKGRTYVLSNRPSFENGAAEGPSSR